MNDIQMPEGTEKIEMVLEELAPPPTPAALETGKETLSRLLAERKELDRRITALRRELRLNTNLWRRIKEGDLAGLEVHTALKLQACGLSTPAKIRARIARDGWRGIAQVKGLGSRRVDEIKSWLARQPVVGSTYTGEGAVDSP